MSTQPRDEDVDEDEVPSQPRRSKGDKKKPQVAIPEEDAEDMDEDDPLADFKDQPVDRQQAQRINGIAMDWEQMRKGVHSSSYALVRDIASSIAEFVDPEKTEKVHRPTSCT